MFANQNSIYLYFDLSPACKKNIVDMYINKAPLKFNNEAKYLRVAIDNKLTWRQRIENIKNKINKRIGILKKMCLFLQEDTLVSLFNSFVKQFVHYGNLTFIYLLILNFKLVTYK